MPVTEKKYPDWSKSIGQGNYCEEKRDSYYLYKGHPDA